MNHEQGYTLLELLVVIAIIGVLAGLADYTLVKRTENARNTQFVEVLGQDLNFARSLAMSRSQRTQLAFDSLSSYTVTYPDLPTTPAISAQSNTKVTLGNVSIGDKIICTSTGFCLGYTAGNALKTINSITAATAGQATKTLSITVLGLARVEQ